MPYETPGSNRGRSSSRQRTRVSVPSSGAYHGPVGTQQRATARGGRPSRGRGGLGRGNPQVGYPLRARNINFQTGRGRKNRSYRPIILGALAIVLVVLLVVGVSSCVRGCSAAPSEQQPTGEQNAIDSRVAAGVTDDLTREFSAELDRGEALAKIAQNASSYDDKALLTLALAHPEAVEFVAGYANASRSGEAVSDQITKGTAPEFYDWDGRWGAVPYGDHAVAVSGSGPVCLSMAHMALTGSAEKTPAILASLAVEKGAATGGSSTNDSGTSSAFFEQVAGDLGLEVKSYQSSAENIPAVLDAGVYLLAEVKAGTLTDEAHWVLMVTENSDNTITVHDPTSPEVTAHPWSPSTLANACDAFLAVSVKSADASTTAQ